MDFGLASLIGIPIYSIPQELCEREETVQRRTHRRSRINKKWRKRYGTKTVRYQVAYMLRHDAFGRPAILHSAAMRFPTTPTDRKA